MRRVIERMPGVSQLMAQILYGSGLRVMECCTLRVKDLDLDRGELTVRHGKGGRDRRTMLPESLLTDIRTHLRARKAQHDVDVRRGVGDGNGSGSLPRRASIAIPRRASAAAIICTRRCCRPRSSPAPARPASASA